MILGLKKTKKKSTQAKEYLVKAFLRKLTLEYSLPIQTQKVSVHLAEQMHTMFYVLQTFCRHFADIFLRLAHFK
jgi:hypothetical protein